MPKGYLHPVRTPGPTILHVAVHKAWFKALLLHHWGLISPFPAILLHLSAWEQPHGNITVPSGDLLHSSGHNLWSFSLPLSFDCCSCVCFLLNRNKWLLNNWMAFSRAQNLQIPKSIWTWPTLIQTLAYNYIRRSGRSEINNLNALETKKNKLQINKVRKHWIRKSKYIEQKV